MMMQPLETELRDALAARAEEVPDAVARRLTSRDYRPRTRDLRPPLAAGVLATAGLATAVVLLVGLGARTPEAFAGWTPTPTPSPRGQIADAEASCRERLTALPTPPRGAVTPAPLPPAEPMSPVLTDTRGPFTFVILAGQHSSASCISGPSFTSVSTNSSTTAPPTVPADRIVLSAEYHTAHDGQAYSFAEGHTGTNVTAATLRLADGTRVQASSDNGWFVAWWPGSSDVVSSDLTTAHGTATLPLEASPGPSCPQAPIGTPNVTCASAYGSGSGSGVQSGSLSLSRAGG
jgi:hypothetical protein